MTSYIVHMAFHGAVLVTAKVNGDDLTADQVAQLEQSALDDGGYEGWTVAKVERIPE